MIELTTSSIAELGAALRSGRARSVELVEQAIANHDESLNAYKHWLGERATGEAELADAAFAHRIDFGPLQGLPVSIKDIYGLAGVATFAGSPQRLPAAWEREGPVVRALRHGLCCVTGKTHTVQFAFGGIGSNAHWGTPRNPWSRDAHHVPGGSSAGAGVSLWEGTAVVALGSDTAGSVRVPASFTGTVGLKTSFGRWSQDGIVPLSPSLDTPGILTRSVEDAALAFTVIDDACKVAPRARNIEGLRFGIVEEMFEDCGPGVAEGVHAALAELEKRGAHVTRATWPELATAWEIFGKGALAGLEFAAFIERELPDFRDLLDPNVERRFAAAKDLPAREWIDRRDRLRTATDQTQHRFEGFDAFVAPTTPITSPRLDDVTSPDDYHQGNMASLRNTSPGNLLELCGLSIPTGLDSDGMPIGLQIMAPRGADEPLLAIGLAVERALGTPRDRLGSPPK